MPFPEPSWGTLPVFPPIVTEASGGKEWSTDHLESRAKDRFIGRWGASRWRMSLSGLEIHKSQIDDFDAFHDLVEGMRLPFLFRLNAKRFEMDNQIGVGNGVQTQFQLKKVRSYAYAAPNQQVEIVRFPWHNYPPMYFGANAKFGLALATEYVRVWVNNVEVTWLSGWDINRETGLVTFNVAPATNAVIRAKCKYLIKVHGMDWMPSESNGGVYAFGEGAMIFEPKGDE